MTRKATHVRQKIIYQDYVQICQWLLGKKTLLVCGNSFETLEVSKCFASPNVVKFSDFTSNPSYDSTVKGVEVFRQSDCNAIVAVGGGSAIDVAKCIKLYSNMDDSRNYLEQDIIANSIPFMAIPTTAGTGSESTRFAVIYYNGEKQSVNHPSCIPDTVVFDVSVLDKLPLYQKKVTMLDAFCHAIESFWSVNSTNESKAYSREAIKLILENMQGYLLFDCNAAKGMFKAANIAGKAINITQTTAGHAMCYKLTSLFGIAHGHAAALCVSKLWPYMLEHTDKCADPRGRRYVEQMFDELTYTMGSVHQMEAVDKFQRVVNKLRLEIPEATEDDIDKLRVSVNSERLKNNPIKLEEYVIKELYEQILESDGET